MKHKHTVYTYRYIHPHKNTLLYSVLFFWQRDSFLISDHMYL